MTAIITETMNTKYIDPRQAPPFIGKKEFVKDSQFVKPGFSDKFKKNNTSTQSDSEREWFVDIVDGVFTSTDINDPKFKIIQDDINNRNRVKKLIETPTRIFHISKVESISNLDGSDYCNGVKKYTVYFKSGNELTIANRDYSYDKLISAYNEWCGRGNNG